FIILILAFLLSACSTQPVLQASHSKDFYPAMGHSFVPLDTTDFAYGITNNHGAIVVSEDGVYMIVAAPQVGCMMCDGEFRLWLSVNGKYVENSNVLLNVDDSIKDVIISQGAIPLKAGDVVQVMMYGDNGIGLEAINRANEPLVPAIIFTMYKVSN
ncbi:hypothetical protein, partial [Vibrio parahaemolyticus]